MTWKWEPDKDWNPALAPPPEPEPEEHEYKVTGNHSVLGHEPGETFTATLLPEQEAHLVWGGHIKRAAAKPGRKKEK